MKRLTPKQVAELMKQKELLLDMDAHKNGKKWELALTDEKGNAEEVFFFKSKDNAYKFFHAVWLRLENLKGIA